MITDTKQYNIIVVEDNIGDFILLQDYLDDFFTNTKISHFEFFRDFRDYFQNHINVTDIILLDLTLPDLSGETLIKEVLNLSQNTPIIVLTGYTDFPFAKTSLSLGISDYLIKDNLNPTVLYKSIIYNLERNKTLTELRLSKKLYFDLFNKSPLPMYAFEGTSLKFLDVNEAALKQYGYTKEQFLKLKLTDIKLSTEEVNDKISQLEFIDDVTHKSETIEFHQTKTGDIIVIEITEADVVYDDTFAKLATAQNITLRLEALYELRLRNERLKKIAWTQSHNVRAPLARILGIIDALENQNLSENERKLLMHNLTASGQELDNVVEMVIKSTSFLK
jgi:PAS domain S-box-containing protein